MLLTEEVEIILAGRNIPYYENLGYEIPRRKDKWGEMTVPMGTKIIVKVEDLPTGSSKKVEVLCDYCKKVIVEKTYGTYNQQRKSIPKDCCRKCQPLKLAESNLLNYGVKNTTQLEEVKDKMKSTNLQKYGVKYAMQNIEIYNKVKNTNILRYGATSPLKNQEILQKMFNTNLNKYGFKTTLLNEEIKSKTINTLKEKYGVDHNSQIPSYRIKYTNTCIERYGVPYVLQNEEIKEKARNTLYKNGNIPTSFQQLEIYNLLKENNYNVELNYPLSNINLDVAIFINDIKIDLEYDCYHWHQDQQKDRRRDEFSKSQGWKILRIKSGHKIPTLDQIIEAINKLINSDRTFTQIVLDDWNENNIKVI